MALLRAGASRVALCDPDVARVGAVVARLSAYWPGLVTGSASPHLHGADLAVNATPLGLRETDPLPFVPGDLPQGAVVADIVMTPAHTRLLAEAQAAGRAVHPGLPMLTHQVESYLEFFGL